MSRVKAKDLELVAVRLVGTTRPIKYSHQMISSAYGANRLMYPVIWPNRVARAAFKPGAILAWVPVRRRLAPRSGETVNQ